MILTAHQSQYLGGYLGLYDKILKADTFCIFDAVQFTSKDFISRNRIRTQDGWQWLTIPTLHKGSQDGLRICDTRIDNNQPWKRKHWKSIQQHYRKAPYFAEHEPAFAAMFERDWEYLASFNETVFRWALDALGIDVRIVHARDYDFRGSKSELVLDMCKQLGASEYWFGAMGRDYADVEAFNAAGVEPRFQDFAHPVYEQAYPGWEPFMCVIDLVFNHGPNSRAILEGKHGS